MRFEAMFGWILTALFMVAIKLLALAVETLLRLPSAVMKALEVGKELVELGYERWPWASAVINNGLAVTGLGAFFWFSLDSLELIIRVLATVGLTGTLLYVVPFLLVKLLKK